MFSSFSSLLGLLFFTLRMSSRRVGSMNNCWNNEFIQQIQPRFLIPTQPVPDFSLSLSWIFQSCSLLVLQEGFSLNLFKQVSTFSRLAKQSLHSTLSSLTQLSLNQEDLHLGATPCSLLACLPYLPPLGISKRQLCKRWSVRMRPMGYFS